MNESVSGLVTLVTGASSGIGAATALRIAAPDTALMLHARGGVDGAKVALLERVAADARERGAEVAVRVGDLGVPGEAVATVRATVERFGRLDRVVSNAGYALTDPIGTLTRDEFDRSHRVIGGAFFDLVTGALPHLTASSCPRVVAVSSFVVDQVPGGRLFPATSAAKGALQALAMSLAAQLAADGVTVNCVAPGFTEKQSAGHSALSDAAWREAAVMTPNGRLATPDDVAAAIAFFLGPDAAHVTGQVLRVDGGLSLV